MAFKCPKCSAEFFDRLKYCPECGFDFTAGQKRCPKCRSQVPLDSEDCPECGLNFEQWAFMVPRLVVFGTLSLILFLILFFPLFWKVTPWVHDKGVITEGIAMTEVDGMPMVPLFIHWKSGDRYIKKSSERREYGENLDYMNQLVPLPPEVVFHYDMPTREEVWIIRRVRGQDHEWVQVGRWKDGPDKYGWVHSSSVAAVE